MIAVKHNIRHGHTSDALIEIFAMVDCSVWTNVTLQLKRTPASVTFSYDHTTVKDTQTDTINCVVFKPSLIKIVLPLGRVPLSRLFIWSKKNKKKQSQPHCITHHHTKHQNTEVISTFMGLVLPTACPRRLLTPSAKPSANSSGPWIAPW